MKNILVIGACGQIGSELTPTLRGIYGTDHVVAADCVYPLKGALAESGPSCKIDATCAEDIANAVKKYNIDTIFNLAAILSAKAEANPMLGWNVGVGAVLNCLEVARELKCSVFTPSSIGAFGPGTPANNTPQDTIQRPQTIYLPDIQQHRYIHSASAEHYLLNKTVCYNVHGLNDKYYPHYGYRVMHK